VIEILQSFEQVAGRFPPVLLLAPGLVLVALGLTVWLAGMCLRRLVLALAGAGVVGFATFLVAGQSPVVTGLAVGGGAVFGAILPRPATAALLAVLGVVVAFLITAQTHLAEQPQLLSGRPEPGPGQERFTTPESLDLVRTHALDLVDHARAAARQLGLADLAVMAASGLVPLALGLLLARLAGALACSVFGSLLIFAGLIVLLIFKGSAPVGLLQRQAALYGLVLLGMTAFGTIEQLVLCPAPKRRRQDGARKSPSRREGSERNWRGR